MHSDPRYSDLVRDTLSYMKELKEPVFSTPEEWQSLHSVKKTAPTPLPPSTFVKPAPMPIKRQILAPPPETPTASVPSPAPEQTSQIKSAIQRLIPSLHHIEHIPEDSVAKRVMSGWREYLSEAEIVVLAADTDPATLELLKNLAKAIDQKLGKVKAFSVERLEREKRWDLFLEKNTLKLIIASEGFSRLKDAMSYVKALPASSTALLGNVPLIILSPTVLYTEAPKAKSLLWGQISQILQR